MISFENYYAFYLLILLLVVYFVSGIVKNFEHYFSQEMLKELIVGKNKKNIKLIYLLISFIFLVIALARPVINNIPIKIPQSNINIVVAFDISASMKCEDIYPTRLDFSKNKFNIMLESLTNQKVGLIGFSSRSFLISPITSDYNTLKYLLANLNQNVVNIQGSHILESLETTNELLKDSKHKALIVFTDGTDENDFDDSIKYAQDNNIKVFIYATATAKGGVIPKENGEIQKDQDGNIVITSLNSNIKELALQSDGAYLEYSARKNDISEFVNLIKSKFKGVKEEDIEINTNQELFYIPLLLALILFLISIGNFRGLRT